MTLKAYSVFDREAGPQEGALLVFAHTAKEAHKIGWPAANDLFCCEFIDVAAHALPIATEWLAEQEGVDLAGEPVVLYSPKSCARCDQWGDFLDTNGHCETCRDLEDA